MENKIRLHNNRRNKSYYLILSDEQLKFLNWMFDNECCDEDISLEKIETIKFEDLR